MEEYAYVVNVDAAVVRNDEYLLIERSEQEDHAAGLLGFPGGKVESSTGDGSAIERTAAREVAEEVGVEVGTVEYVHSSTFEADDGTPCLNVVTCCEYAGGEARPRATEEVAAVHWLAADEIEARNDVPEFTEQYVRLVEEFRTGE
ncbi:NUDIX domain-containing protein [Halorussus salinisoli]|uniref:NUDIX domain-containing protein n=1 Tax=Halorussus salinisoli TaxID=2558242 RepID=UPI0010C1D5D5|nr:NUDIX domain-containing protein [Halorussus salinisoli]